VFNFKDTPYFFYLSHMVWIWILTELPFLYISCFFLIWVWIRIVSKLSFPDISCIFLIWIWIITKLHFPRKTKGTHCCGLLAAMHHTTQPGTIRNLGWSAKYLSFAKIFFDARTGYWQIHNCQLGPFDGLSLGMGRPESTLQEHVNQWMDGRWTGNIFPLGSSSLANHNG
jgi:hypothetical protein